jgi:NAD(P)-dependent dehydrogenase (short-subunit alcohol dehydrogenase family)
MTSATNVSNPAGTAHWSFSGKVVLVTGAARGIGNTIAGAFGKAGAKVAIADINHRNAKDAAEELQRAGINAEYFLVDLAQKGEPERLVAAVAQHFGRLDALINNARAGTRLNLNNDTEDNWELTLSVGLRAANFASRAALPFMQANGGGSIVNISSIAAQLVSLESGSYHATKAGLVQLTRYLAANAGPQNVCVNAVLPGFIVQTEHQTRFHADDNAEFKSRADSCHPLGRVGSSSDIAETVLFLCSDAARFITGQAIVVDGGFSLRDAWNIMASLYDLGNES